MRIPLSAHVRIAALPSLSPLERFPDRKKINYTLPRDIIKSRHARARALTQDEEEEEEEEEGGGGGGGEEESFSLPPSLPPSLVSIREIADAADCKKCTSSFNGFARDLQTFQNRLSETDGDGRPSREVLTPKLYRDGLKGGP